MDATAGDTGIPGPAGTLRIATWNIEWLHAEDNTGFAKRDEDDYAALRRYATKLDADIVAFQEVYSEEAAARVFDSSQYDVAISSRNDPQRTGFVYRKTLEVQRYPDLDALDLEGDGSLRYGVDIGVTVDDQEFRLLAIHLKSSCFAESLDSSDPDCRTLKQQIPPLEGWIDARASEDIPFIVLGDFNRRFDSDTDTMFDDLSDGDPDNANLLRVTRGHTSKCNGGTYPIFIDHLLLDPHSASWFVKDSFMQLLYTAEDRNRVLSDHCPISVDLTVRAQR